MNRITRLKIYNALKVVESCHKLNKYQYTSLKELLNCVKKNKINDIELLPMIINCYNDNFDLMISMILFNCCGLDYNQIFYYLNDIGFSCTD